MTFTEWKSRKSCPQRDPAGEPHVPREHLIPQKNLIGVSDHVCVSLLRAHEWLYRPVTRKSAATTAKIWPKPDFWLGGRHSLAQRQRGGITRATRVKENYEEWHLVSAQLGCQTSLLLMFLFLIFLLAFRAQTSSSWAKEPAAMGVSPDGPFTPRVPGRETPTASSPWLVRLRAPSHVGRASSNPQHQLTSTFLKSDTQSSSWRWKKTKQKNTQNTKPKPNPTVGHNCISSLPFTALSKSLLLLTKAIFHLHFLLALLNYMCLHLL